MSEIQQRKRIICVTAIVLIVSALFAMPAAALTEAEVQTQVESIGREKVVGNVFIWFLCAIGFLKVAQKMDSFLSALGISTGRTGGSMLSEAMIAAKSIGAAVKNFGGSLYSGTKSSGGGGFISQSIGTTIGHSIKNSAVQSAVGKTSDSVGGAVFQHSLNKGGSFANNVISKIAQGDIKTDGTLSGNNAAKAFSQYIGIDRGENQPEFRNVEIGGGRMSGTELNADNPSGIDFGMYSAEQYVPPKGEFETVQAVDGSQWYRQYAQDTVERKPYTNAEGKVTYHEEIVQRVPDPPKRKERL